MGLFNSLFKKKSETASEMSPEVVKIFEKIRDYMEDENLQNSRFPPMLRDKVLAGIAVDELPHGIGEFGLSEMNPIPVNGAIGELLYLSKLMTKDTKQKILFHRIGSAEGIDVYETVSIDGQKWDILFLSLYHPRKSRKAPIGYQITDSKSQPLIYGTNRRVNQFPYGLQKAIKDTTEQIIGIALPPPEVRMAEETISFKRPIDHERRIRIAMQNVEGWMGEGTPSTIGPRFVPCKNPSCGNMPLNIEVGQARALLEHNLRNNPTAAFTLTCDRCGFESHYNYTEILALIAPQRRPQPLPEGQHWALVLFELSTAETMEYRGFFAERVLVEIQTRTPDAWRGKLLGSSLFSPSLHSGAQIGGPIVSTFLICQWWISGQSQMPISVQDVPKGSVFGIFFGNKGRQLVYLQAANLFCINPSCNFVFSSTYSQVKEMLAGAHEKPIGSDTSPTLMFTCELCGTSRVVDESSFVKLFHV